MWFQSSWQLLSFFFVLLCFCFLLSSSPCPTHLKQVDLKKKKKKKKKKKSTHFFSLSLSLSLSFFSPSSLWFLYLFCSLFSLGSLGWLFSLFFNTSTWQWTTYWKEVSDVSQRRSNSERKGAWWGKKKSLLWTILFLRFNSLTVDFGVLYRLLFAQIF